MGFVMYHLLYSQNREIGIVKFWTKRQADDVLRCLRRYDNSLRIIPLNGRAGIYNPKIRRIFKRFFDLG